MTNILQFPPTREIIFHAQMGFHPKDIAKIFSLPEEAVIKILVKELQRLNGMDDPDEPIAS